MIIELRGVEFVNKGAELMLHAIMAKVKEQIPHASFVMQKGLRTPEEKLRQHGIYIKLNFKKYKLPLEKIGGFLPKKLIRNKGYILPKEIDVVLDGSGFAFGDQWGAQYAENRLGSKIVCWKQQGKKIVLLPQAFGPFTDADLQAVMVKIVKHADLVFAREKQSYEYLHEVAPQHHIHTAPDFTNLIKGKIPAGFDRGSDSVAIIPNYKMIEKEVGEDVYFNFLLTCIQKVKELSLKPYFLIHEGKKDMKIAESVNQKLSTPIDIVYNPDALAIKGIISTAYFVICSRFHGVVSALSQGIPCLATSWSHKYEMLVNEYECPEGLFKSLSDAREIEEKISAFKDPENHKKITEKLLKNSALLKHRSEAMWQTVFETINNPK